MRERDEFVAWLDARDAEDEARAEEREEASREPVCPRGCPSWRECDEPGPDCSATPSRERHGIGVCVTGVCSEPCGMDGGCAR